MLPDHLPWEPCDTPSWSEWLQLISPTFTKDPMVSAVFEVGFFAFLEHHTNIIQRSYEHHHTASQLHSHTVRCSPKAPRISLVSPNLGAVGCLIQVGESDTLCKYVPASCHVSTHCYSSICTCLYHFIPQLSSTTLTYTILIHLIPAKSWLKWLSDIPQPSLGDRTDGDGIADNDQAYARVKSPPEVSTMQPSCWAANSNFSWYSRNIARGIQKMALS